MAKYRPIHVRIWKDPDFQTYSPEHKLIFLYLCTNDATSESGIYPLTLRTVANETDIDLARITEVFETGAVKNVFYDPENQFVFVKNFRKYNSGGRPALIEQAISNEYTAFRTPLWDQFKAEYPEFSKTLQKVKVKVKVNVNVKVKVKRTVVKPLGNGSETVSKKESYGEFKNVHLTATEYQKLIEKFGSENVALDRIENLSRSKSQHGYKYKDDYATVLTWERKDQKKQEQERALQDPGGRVSPGYFCQTDKCNCMNTTNDPSGLCPEHRKTEE